MALLCAPVPWIALGCTAHEAEKAPRPDVVLIVIDTLRADHTSAYGYSRPTTPNLERIAKAGTTFELAYAPAGETNVSHATLFTSKYPLAHGVVRNGLELGPEEFTLAERLRQEGYQTAAFVSSFPVSRLFGYAQGFEHFDDSFDASRSSARHRVWVGADVPEGFDRSPQDTTDAAVRWLRSSRQLADPMFLWVHYFDPHSPYSPPAEYARRFVPDDARDEARSIAEYDAEVSYSDAEVGRLLEQISQRESDRGTLLIITSDHGEGLWDHGLLYHGYNTYEEEVRVPLFMIWRGRIPEGHRSRQPAHFIDIVPTIARALELQNDASGFDGVDLLPYLDGRTPPDPERPIFVQRPHYPKGRPEVEERGEGYAVRVGRWKLFEALEEGRQELYDLAEDPRETHDLASAEPERVAALSARIAAWKREQETRTVPRDLSVPDQATEGLRALGYLGEGSHEAVAQ